MDDASGTKKAELVRRDKTNKVTASSDSNHWVTDEDTTLEWEFVNRSAAVHQIINNFFYAYADMRTSVRPSVVFAPQMYGVGKTTLGRNFRDFVLLNRQALEENLVWFPGIADDVENVGERAVKALLNETIYVSIDLSTFPEFDEEDFELTLVKEISKEALSHLPNNSELLAKVLESRHHPEDRLISLFQVTNKRYLFLFIDEIAMLPSRKFYEFPDLNPQRKPGKPNIYQLFFQVLTRFLLQPFVICFIAGRSNAISNIQEDAAVSRVFLEFVRLDPFSEDNTKLFIQGMTTSKGATVLQLLFPDHPEGNDWFFKQVHGYTGGVPRYIVHVMQELVDTSIHDKLYNLTEGEMYAKIEGIYPHIGDLATPTNMKPNTLRVFCALLLASILEYQFLVPLNPYVGGFLGENSQCVLNIANNFGVYYEYCSEKGRGLYEATEQPIKLVYPKIVLKAVKESYWHYPLIRYIYYLFPLNVPVESPSSLRFRFKIIFAAILYVRCSLSRRLGELSLFHQSFVEDTVWEIEKCRVKTIPSFKFDFRTKYSDKEQSYAPNAWKDFYDKYLSEDGIFLPNRDNSNGPDILIRVSVPMHASSSSHNEGQSCLTPVSTHTSSKRRRVYVIGITLKYYHNSSVSIDMIKEEADKFLVPVSSQLDLEKNDIWAIQLIVSTSYNNEVSSHFTDKQNWIMNTGVYYEECFKKKHPSLSASQDTSNSDSDNESLYVGPNCQLVVCSAENLKNFLGQQVYDQLRKAYFGSESVLKKLDPLGKLLGHLLPSHLPLENILSTRRDTDEMEVKEMRRERIPCEKSFDWNTFLREQCGFSDEEVSYCLPKIKEVPSDMLADMTLGILQKLGIDKLILRLKIRIAIKAYLSKRVHN
ncbi:hypothetical protein GAYE_PCTG14G0530 [Galdieria yellowstonensis]|uniref:Archaeal ATPase n=1 Tax=Galdieria yellowstonensis TaxID=3028027 RepID=A0AAV9I3K6_9RHOD|nr:hypothetical protein GAYE_PCTG14G0530 [Galdieria yellowstonensis]